MDRKESTLVKYLESGPKVINVNYAVTRLRRKGRIVTYRLIGSTRKYKTKDIFGELAGKTIVSLPNDERIVEFVSSKLPRFQTKGGKTSQAHHIHRVFGHEIGRKIFQSMYPKLSKRGGGDRKDVDF